ncbi:MAG: glycosyltransferase [Halorhodospira sp.]
MTSPGQGLEAVHQFHAGAAHGDGVTNSMLFIRSLLRVRGYDAQIFAGAVPPELRGEIRPYTDYQSRPGQLLLQHHSMGHDLGDWLAGVADPRILVYHNITPATFFPAGSLEASKAEQGRCQLHAWAAELRGAIALSRLNEAELLEAGYDPVVTLPLLLDRAAIQAQPAAAEPWPGERRLAFVGRIAPNKRQDLLVDMMAYLRRLDPHKDHRLILAGRVTDPGYLAQLQARIRQLGLARYIHLPGKLSDEQLYGLYDQADLFVCASDHEGFGIPLVEAQARGVPVVARATSSVADTVGEGGLLLTDGTPAEMAATAQCVLTDAGLAARLRAGAQRNLRRFDRTWLAAELDRFLRERYGPASAQAAGPDPGGH